ncbi:uncharacterized protein TNIN_170071 [Trichonephila inaurata madagascariensis]|uniref:Uncharacterized protein n=1 Tax=Trichonephila inaurata madagascariensis TaxID=2747483 RepID=A0A8X6XYP3_9ARAC|nr:uncharacterized protein TNIN_170071 [Trichonephila inaurata madagascariensis]
MTSDGSSPSTFCCDRRLISKSYWLCARFFECEVLNLVANLQARLQRPLICGTKMDFNSPATLRFYSSVTAVSSLFYHENLYFLREIQSHRVGWVTVQDTVAMQVKLLNLPDSVKKSLTEVIQPVGDQIRKWLCKHESVIQKRITLYGQFSWTSHAMIDYKKTAENLLNSGELEPSSAFILACINSIEDYVSLLWPKVKNVRKDIIRCLRQNKKLDTNYPPEVTLWVAKVSKNLASKYLSANGHTGEKDIDSVGFLNAVLSGNTASARYFITKLDPQSKPQEIRQSVVNIMRCGRRFNPSTLLFLFSQMDNNQIDQILRGNAENALVCFLEWPLQKFFLILANKLWNCMSQDVFHSVLLAIVQQITQYQPIPNYTSFENPDVYRKFYFECIFKEFWLSSPEQYRLLCIEELITPIISYLFNPHRYVCAMRNLFKDESSYVKLEKLFFTNADAVLLFIQ